MKSRTMKYLKRFNEELKSSTYMNASRKLDKIGHKERAKEIKDYVGTIEAKESMENWKKNIQEFSKYGKFRISLKDKNGSDFITDDFYLNFVSCPDVFLDSLDDGHGNMNSEGSFLFLVGLIPIGKECLKRCQGAEHDGKKVFNSDEFSNGFYFGMSVYINYEIKNDVVVLLSLNIDEYDYYKPFLADRRTAVQFKNLLKNIFSNPDLNYPSGYTDITNIYKKLEATICSQAGFSSDYGFSLEQVAQFIDKIPINSLYKR